MTYLSYWRCGSDYRLQTDDGETANRVKGWGFSRLAGSGMNFYLRLFTIPNKHNHKARKMLGLKQTGDVMRRGLTG